MVLNEEFKAQILEYVGKCIDMNAILSQRLMPYRQIEARLTEGSLMVHCYEFEYGSREEDPPKTVWKTWVTFRESEAELEREFAELDVLLLETYWGDQEHD